MAQVIDNPEGTHGTFLRFDNAVIHLLGSEMAVYVTDTDDARLVGEELARILGDADPRTTPGHITLVMAFTVMSPAWFLFRMIRYKRVRRARRGRTPRR